MGCGRKPSFNCAWITLQAHPAKVGEGLVCLDSSGIGEILGIMDNIHDYLTILGCSEGIRERHRGQDVG
jgi:hypothetical protein